MAFREESFKRILQRIGLQPIIKPLLMSVIMTDGWASYLLLCAHSEHVKLVLSQTAPLGIHFLSPHD